MIKIGRILPLVIFLTLSLLLLSCGGGADTGITSNLSTVEPYYSLNGANWNDYVNDDGSDMFSASDTTCNPVNDSACIHGGQIMSMEVLGQTSCVGLSAEDSLSVFEWGCDDSVSPIRFISTGFMPGKGLSDLIDFNSAVFKENYLEVHETGNLIVYSNPEAWWENDIVVNNDGSNGNDMNAGEIHIVTQNANTTYTIGADKVAVLVKPDVVLTGSATGNETVVSAANRNFLWLEGMIDATDDSYAIRYDTINYSTINNVEALNATSCVSLYSSSYNTLKSIKTNNCNKGLIVSASSNNNALIDITASDNINTGVYIDHSSNNMLNNITVRNNDHGTFLNNSSDNTLNNVMASSNRYGVQLIAASDNNVLSEITMTSNRYGVALSASLNNMLSNITASGNYYGIYLVSSSNNNMLSNTSAYSNSYGIYINGSSNSKLENIASSNNDIYGVSLINSSNNIFSGQLLVGSNASSNCNVLGGINPGQTGGTCANQGSSDATLNTDASLASSYVDAAGGDYSLVSTDTVIRDMLTVPTGADTYTHTWSDFSTTEMLRNALEIQGDDIGNENLLCESNETCLYTPNIAAYQGHGNVIQAGTFSDGTVTGVTLMFYETNGH